MNEENYKELTDTFFSETNSPSATTQEILLFGIWKELKKLNGGRANENTGNL